MTSKSDKMGLRYKPMLFTEQGVAMLSSILRSKRAIQVNIQIMRLVINLRQMYIGHEDLKRKIVAMERKYSDNFESTKKKADLRLSALPVLHSLLAKEGAMPAQLNFSQKTSEANLTGELAPEAPDPARLNSALRILIL